MARPKQRTGELGDHLLATALGLLDAGDDSLRARVVADAAGTSTAALYELYGDKEGLLRALFSAGFRRLAAALHDVASTTDARRDLVAVLAAARRFGLDHPLLFELMFARPFAEFRPTAQDQRAARDTYRTVMAVVDRAIADGVLAGDRVDLAQVLVATNRGLVATELAGILGSSRRTTDRRWRLAIGAVIDGCSPHADADGR